MRVEESDVSVSCLVHEVWNVVEVCRLTSALTVDDVAARCSCTVSQHSSEGADGTS